MITAMVDCAGKRDKTILLVPRSTRQYYEIRHSKMQDQTARPGIRAFLYSWCIALTVVFFGGLVYWTLLLAYGNAVFLGGTPEAIRRATKLDPWNATYWAELATLDIARSNDAARRAAELDPLNSAYWIQRGILAEFGGDLKSAERYYLEAARVSRLFSPRFALMNFYFRQGRQEQFWKWARPAFDMSYGDLSGAFLLCWNMTPDAEVILNRALPRTPRILSQFLPFVAKQAGVDAARPVADALLRCADSSGRDPLLDYCEGLLLAKRFAAAREIWRGMASRGLLSSLNGSMPDGSTAKNVLYDALFDATPLQRGFDWRLISSPDAKVRAGGYRGEIDLTLTGKQPEECDILSQIAELENGSAWRFSLEHRAAGDSDPGLTWEIADLETGAELARLPLKESDDWSPQAVQFDGRKTRFIRVALRYARRPGTVRYEGRVLIRQLRLQRAD
jgi:hypothetical protein